MLDYAGISFRWKWIEAVPSRIETLENYQLDELLRLADYLMNNVRKDRSSLSLLNTWESVKSIQFPEEEEAEEIYKAVKREKERRSPPPLSQNVGPTAKKRLKEPPAFEDLFVPGAIERVLAAAQKVGMVNVEGETITWKMQGKKAAILALWQAVIAKNLANSNYVTGRIACSVIAQKFGTSVDRNIYDSMAKYIEPLKKELMHHL